MNSLNQANPLVSKLKLAKGWATSRIKAQLINVGLGLGVDLPLRTADRRVLETVIIPYFVNQDDCCKLLFVGCQWYTKHYEKFFKDKEYWTIEIDPDAKKYGAKNHVIDSLQNLSSYFAQNYFDAIIYNGVFGWGINSREDANAAFSQCHNCLRTDGILVFGWNNVPERTPFSPNECPELSRFKPYLFPPLSASDYAVADSFQNHTFRFYTKKSNE